MNAQAVANDSPKCYVVTTNRFIYANRNHRPKPRMPILGAAFLLHAQQQPRQCAVTTSTLDTVPDIQPIVRSCGQQRLGENHHRMTLSCLILEDSLKRDYGQQLCVSTCTVLRKYTIHSLNQLSTASYTGCQSRAALRRNTHTHSLSDACP